MSSWNLRTLITVICQPIDISFRPMKTFAMHPVVTSAFTTHPSSILWIVKFLRNRTLHWKKKKSCHCIVQYLLKWQGNYYFFLVKELTWFWQGICQISVKKLSKSSQFLVKNLSKSGQFLVGSLSKICRFLVGSLSRKFVQSSQFLVRSLSKNSQFTTINITC